jgi:ABC-type amino acid transport substrate-binding protein
MVSFVYAKVRVGIVPTSIPNTFINEDGEIDGFDINLMEAIAKIEDIDYEFVQMNFEALIPALELGNIDVIFSGMLKTDERAKKIDFGNSYLETGTQIAVKNNNNNINNFNDLKDKKIGVMFGSMQADYVKELGFDNNVLEFSVDTIINALLFDKVDAIVMAEIDIKEYNARQKKKTIKGVGEVAPKKSACYGVKKGANAELLKKMNTGLRKIKKNGVYVNVYKKWYGDI